MNFSQFRLVVGVFVILSMGRLSAFAEDVNNQSTYTVCGATMNSFDEFEVFKQELKREGGFIFEELTDNAPYAQTSQREEWFHNSCRNKQIQCDILIVSGHFGGHFFGDNQKYDLYLSTLENASCQNSCSNIINRPLETFLFGCNTLAGKKDDGRNRQEYRRLLINEDHIPPDQADRIIAARYGPWGGTWGDRMVNGFRDVVNIYGYTSRSPLGKNNKTNVRRYIREIQKNYGSYKNYLDKLLKRRRNFHSSNKDMKNKEFFTSFAGQLIHQEQGSRGQEQYYQDVCQLKAEEKSIEDRLKLVDHIFNRSSKVNDPDRLKYFLIISEMIQQNVTFVDRMRLQHVLEPIANFNIVREQFLEGLAKTESPPILIDLAILGHTVGWLSESQAAQVVREALYNLDEKHPNAKYGQYLACVSGQNYKDLGRYFNYDEIRESSDSYKIEMIGCLHMVDEESKNFFLNKYLQSNLTREEKFDLRLQMFNLQEELIPNEQQISLLISKYEAHESEQPDGCYYELGQVMTILDNLPNVPPQLDQFYKKLERDKNRNQCDHIVEKHREKVKLVSVIK